MTRALCSSCSKPVTDSAYLCAGERSCTERLARALGDVAAVTFAAERSVWREELPDRCVMAFGRPTMPWERRSGVAGDLANELATTLARQSRSGESGNAGSGDRPVLWDDRASRAGERLRNALATWTRLVLEERGEQAAGGYPVDTPRHVARWLLVQLEWLRHHRDAASCLADVDGAVSLLRRAVDRPPDLWFAGPCDGNGLVSELAEHVAGHDTTGCAERLYAKPNAPTVDCRACQLTYDVPKRRDWLLEAAQDMLAHAELIGRAAPALGLQVTPSMIRGYAHRGRLEERGTDLAGRPLYRVGDVIDVAQDVLAEADRKRDAAAAKRARRAVRERSA